MCADVCLNCCFFGERVLLTEGFLVSCAVVDLPELGERTGEERKCSDFCFLSSFAELLVTSHTVGHSVYTSVAPGHAAVRPPLQSLLEPRHYPRKAPTPGSFHSRPFSLAPALLTVSVDLLALDA